MKSFATTIIITIGCMLGLQVNSYASHAAGAELYYVNVGRDSFMVTYNFYKDCFGSVTAPNTVSIDISSNTCNIAANTVTLTQVTNIYPQNIPNGSSIVPVCSSAVLQTTCYGGMLPGIVQIQYTGLLVLPTHCSNWKLSYSECCRNNAITNITNASSYELYVEATLNNLDAPDISSPLFKNQPTIFCYQQQLTMLDNGAYDADGDSLAFSLTSPLDVAATPLTVYQSGLSATKPFLASGPIILDSTSGQLTFTPSTTQVGVIVVLVRAYRHGVLVSSIMRDMQAVVINTGSTAAPVTMPPISASTISGGTSTGTNSITTCIGNQLTFKVSAVGSGVRLTSTTPTFIPSVHFNNQTYPSSHAGMDSAIGTFTWVPTAADTGLNLFNIAFSDTVCPIGHTGSLSISVRVLANTQAGPDLVYCPGGVPAHLSASSGATQFTWSPATGLDNAHIANPTASPSVTTNYIVTTNLAAGCRNTDTVKVVVVPAFQVTNLPTTETNLCQNQQATLTVLPDNSSAPYTYKWTPTTALSDSTSSSVVASPVANTTYTVQVSSLTGCVKTSNFVVNNIATLPIFSARTGVCKGDTIHLSTGFPASLGAVTYSWSPATGLTSTTAASTIATVTQPITYTLNYSSSNGCSGTKTIALGSDSLHIIAYGDTTLCHRDTVQLRAVAGGVVNTVITGCGVGYSQCNGGTTIELSPTNVTNTGNSLKPSIYGSYYGSRKVQILYRASELLNAGLTAGTIKSIAFDVASIPNGAFQVFRDFEIKMKCVSDTQLSPSQFLSNTGMVEVFNPKDHNIAGGWNTHTFDNFYNWDGQSSLLVEVCYNNNTTGSTNVLTHGSYTPYNSMVGIAVDYITACTLVAPSAYDSLRPNTRFGMCSGGSYQVTWSPSATISNATALATKAYANTTTTYIVEASSGACHVKDSVKVQVSELQFQVDELKPDRCQANLGKIVVTANGGNPGYQFRWRNGTIHQTAGKDSIDHLAAGSYTLTVTDTIGCHKDTVLTIADACDSVWPGDADYNGVANVTDILSLGLQYGSTGVQRQAASTNWIPQSCQDWQTAHTYIDAKHADCNGDGIVSFDDTLAVTLNYGLTHQKAGNSLSTPTDPPLSFVAVKDTIKPGDYLYLDIIAGSQALPVDYLYGLACTVAFDTTVFEAGYVQLNGNNSWLGNTGSSLLLFHKSLPSLFRIDFALTRTNQVDAGGYGKIGQLVLRAKGTLPYGRHSQTITLTPTVWKAILSTAAERGFESALTPVTISDGIDGIDAPTLAQSISLYPNPSNGHFTLTFNQASKTLSIELLNIQGQQLYTEQLKDVTSLQKEFDFSNLAKGVYLLKISTENGVGVKRVVLE